MTGPPELVLCDGGRDGGYVGLFQDAGVGASILPADPEDLAETPLMVRLECL